MDVRTFGNYLSRMRKAQGLTQAELAEQLFRLIILISKEMVCKD